MCGIVAAIGQGNVVPMLIGGLRRLEYRGYDSAGIALVGNRVRCYRSVGRVEELVRNISGAKSAIGIAHTRWATHGAATEKNAHPHSSTSAGIEVSVVHNGIIENHEMLRRELQDLNYVFESDTDSEVIAHLVHHAVLAGHGLFESVQRVTTQLEGAFAIAVVSSTEPRVVVGARHGSPLVLGVEDKDLVLGGKYFASDAYALSAYVTGLYHLEDGEVAELRSDGIAVVNVDRGPVTFSFVDCELRSDETDCVGYETFTRKEIFEQPKAIAKTIEPFANMSEIVSGVFGLNDRKALSGTQRVLILACGSSYYAGLMAKHWLEAIAACPTSVEIASEYRYRMSVPLEGTLVVCVSQSGETADTLGALETAKSLGMRSTFGICNVEGSALHRQTEFQILTRAGPEIGVASTKAFVTQLVALLVLTIALGKARGAISAERETSLLVELQRLPALIQNTLNCETQVQSWADIIASRKCAVFLGRGIQFPVALEGALKLKELSYIQADAYPAGELKHGPLALVTESVPVIVLAPNDRLLHKLKSNLHEVRARNGELFVISQTGASFSEFDSMNVLRLEQAGELLSPFASVVPLQLLAYHTAVILGRDVDKPRNLAKSVTVE
jgi:glucosamine--fructose-6-phosphate aminotransferase (isomerizing)